MKNYRTLGWLHAILFYLLVSVPLSSQMEVEFRFQELSSGDIQVFYYNPGNSISNVSHGFFGTTAYIKVGDRYSIPDQDQLLQFIVTLTSGEEYAIILPSTNTKISYDVENFKLTFPKDHELYELMTLTSSGDDFEARKSSILENMDILLDKDLYSSYCYFLLDFSLSNKILTKEEVIESIGLERHPSNSWAKLLKSKLVK